MKVPWAGLFLAGLLTMVGCGGSGSSSSGTIYVATQGDSMVSAFRVDTSNGTVSSVGNSQTAGTMPIALTLSPSGTTLFAANQADSTISSFPVGGDGSLSASSGTTSLAGTPQAMAINAAGSFLFVVIQNVVTDPGSVQVFSVSGSSLTSVGVFAAGIGASAIVAAPSGNQVYVTNSADATVSAYAVDASGNLSLIAAPYVTGGTSPAGVGLSPNGNFLYVANSGSNNITVYTACIAISNVCPAADGSLVQVNTTLVSSGLGPTVVRAHPTLDVIYVLDAGSNQISQYSFSTGDGSLTPLSPPSISTGVSPVSMALQPAGWQIFTANIGASQLSGFNINRTSGVLFTTGQMIFTAGQPAALAAK